MKNYLLPILFCIVLSACSESTVTTPEEQVKQTLEAIELAAEARSLKDFMQHISDDYADHQGNDKQAIRRLVQLQYIRNQKIHIFSTIRSLEVQDQIATVELSTAMAAREADLLDESTRLRADTHRFSIVLREDDEASWLVESVSWQRGWE
ncbi:MAG: hypothetical protein AAF542_25705 [Pseudomonadota bacterium]